MFAREAYLNKRGISLLQRSIETAERSRIKWLSLPNVLNRYMFTEHDPHSERDQKSESDRKAGRFCEYIYMDGWRFFFIYIYELRMQIYMSYNKCDACSDVCPQPKMDQRWLGSNIYQVKKTVDTSPVIIKNHKQTHIYIYILIREDVYFRPTDGQEHLHPDP